MKKYCKLFLSLSSLILTLLVLEISLRNFYTKYYQQPPWQTTSRFRLDNRLIYSLTANTYTEWKTQEFVEKVKTNNLGFRNISNTKTVKDKDTFRVIMVGDSFIFGHGLTNEQTIPAVLVKIFEDQKVTNRKVEVINAGVPGYSPDPEYRQIVENLIPFRPDLIIWSVQPGNIGNMIDNVPSLYKIGENDILEPLDARLNWLYIQNFLFVTTPKWIQNTYLFDFVVNKLSSIQFLTHKPALKGKELDLWAEKKLYLEISSIHKLTSEKNINFLIVFFPNKQSLQLEKGNDYQKLFSRIQDKLAKEKIPYLDITGILKEDDNTLAEDSSENILGVSSIQPAKLFFKQDFHPNGIGAEIFGKLIANYLLRYLLPYP